MSSYWSAGAGLNNISAIFLAIPALAIMSSCSGQKSNQPKMSCAEAISEQAAADAVSRYSTEHSRYHPEIHLFLTASGFFLRNMALKDGTISFVYVLEGGFRTPCLLRRLVMIDTTLVVVTTDSQLKILSIQ
ncbi:hypothetical protein [Mesorhizobium sp. ES1-4]|uniref:hypothetical protein n=1 Tax=Mesorhizobium sp. ES1-4 TaxID=2876627 RepID=UPI001CCA10E3|nr:hypothetical protein [Mesorhizobium sp. ES1-4]MBZ9799307.1 hypothetical protein [Mesorhizobium sp. ES1-4]